MKVALIVLALAAFAGVACAGSYKPIPYSEPDYYKGNNYMDNNYMGNNYKGNNNYNSYSPKAYDYAPAEYEFAYKVEDDYAKLNFGQNEQRKGDYTSGYYYVDLPDHRRQKVTYYVDGKSGYIANVEYEGVAKYQNDYKPIKGYTPSTYTPSTYTPEYPKMKYAPVPY